ncbi:MAG: phosphoribosylformylglycinamidine synthase subunit PurL, partial [Actinomycetota bacterium]|nr:phosphoribosylformylglycinamidine synthase subunit PurL [Actinomycetota bacterium]
AEACLAGGLGARLDLGEADDPVRRLFGEGPGGFVVSGPPEAIRRLGERMPLSVFGTVGGDALEVGIGAQRVSLPLSALGDAHAHGLAQFLQ